MNNTDRTLISGWEGTVRNASSWMTGPRAKLLTNLADEMKAIAEGEATAELVKEDDK